MRTSITDSFGKPCVEENDIKTKYELLRQFADAPAFSQPDSFYCETPFRRPVRPQDLDVSLLRNPISKDQLGNSDHLLAQRLLLNTYEQDLMFLPTEGQVLDFEKFQEFYSPSCTVKGRSVRPDLERYCFQWLEDSISISSNWNIASFTEYTQHVIYGIGNADSKLSQNIINSKDPLAAAKFYLIQCAGEFLTEASAMGRNIVGSFGPHISELFKILLDEYGYGIHEKKHSTIFEQLMKQAGMSSDIHYYWQFYTSTSIALINYFHYLSTNHGAFFKYIGALYFTEATLASTTVSQSKLFKSVFKGTVSTQYFDEHSHIDIHHGRMTLDKLIVPLVNQFGNRVLIDILTGFEEFTLLQNVAEEDFFSHIHWHDRLDEYKQKAREMRSFQIADIYFEEKKNELSVPHTHPVDELFWVENGQMELVVSPMKSVTLNEGEGIVIPKGMLHGSLVLSSICKYSVTAIV
jgi:mannose-6-phosphate isomerase-like protein (cupin superfamily)